MKKSDVKRLIEFLSGAVDTLSIPAARKEVVFEKAVEALFRNETLDVEN